MGIGRLLRGGILGEKKRPVWGGGGGPLSLLSGSHSGMGGVSKFWEDIESTEKGGPLKRRWG